jgi:UDP-N-acetylmuramoyl-L-alanyl-D-glutamate--2,6-diaminopimelate ligase
MIQAGLSAARPLAELTAGMLEVPAGIEIADLTLDSRAVQPGGLFLACRGLTHHGVSFAAQAAARGARAILFDTDAPAPQVGRSVFVAGLPQLRRHVGTIADRFFGAPSRTLSVAGVTGTNGKTTCAYLLAQALTLCGHRAAYIGTIGVGFPAALRPVSHTTADVVTVHRQLAELADLGAECVAMEVSSHALELGRVDAVRFNAAAFTNLTHDHLDLHGSMQAYGAAKARLFERDTLASFVINVDDAFGAGLAAGLARRAAAGLVVTSHAAVRAPAPPLPGARRVQAVRTHRQAFGQSIDIESSWGPASVSVPLFGDFNLENVLTVLALLLAAQVPLEQAVRALGDCTAPPGRLERIPDPAARVLAIVDYAHTPDALEKALHAVRGHCSGRLSVVFGCGGDRDAGKRPLMGRIAAELADRVIVTDDNPRSEDPGRIVRDILAGIAREGATEVEHDRARAIRAALERCASGDAVVIAGKGHEDYQIYGSQRRAFSDQAVVREYFEASRDEGRA